MHGVRRPHAQVLGRRDREMLTNTDRPHELRVLLQLQPARTPPGATAARSSLGLHGTWVHGMHAFACACSCLNHADELPGLKQNMCHAHRPVVPSMKHCASGTCGLGSLYGRCQLTQIQSQLLTSQQMERCWSAALWMGYVGCGTHRSVGQG